MWSGGVEKADGEDSSDDEPKPAYHAVTTRFASFLFCAITVVSIIAGSLTPRHNRGFLY